MAKIVVLQFSKLVKYDNVFTCKSQFLFCVSLSLLNLRVQCFELIIVSRVPTQKPQAVKFELISMSSPLISLSLGNKHLSQKKAP